jgi:iron complex transport system ATP-binding protein
MEQAKTILSAQNLSIGYHNKKGLSGIAHGINLDLRAGKLIALIGANGIGKSTLLKTLTAIQKPLEGSILLNGKNVADYSAEALAQQLSIVLTESLPPSNLTIYELVALGRQPYTNWLGTLSAEDTGQIEKAIQLTQIGHLIHKKHYEVSDGQLQKALIARALAQDTPLIILDEPTTHLDLLHKVSLLKLLKKLSAETEKCIFYSTHDLDLALKLSDEIVVMTPGAVVQGTPQELIQQKSFDNIFNDSSIQFDAGKGGFTLL